VNATRLWLAVSGAVSVTCIPNLGPGDSLITSTRVLALRADPAEAVPGTLVTFTSFVVGSTGVLSGSPIAWDFCTAPRPLTDDNIVSNACLNSSSVLLRPWSDYHGCNAGERVLPIRSRYSIRWLSPLRPRRYGRLLPTASGHPPRIG
jgi:hypothetical protein